MQHNGDPITLYQQVLASCTGALVTAVLMTPFDVVKTRLQAQQSAGGGRLIPERCSYIFCNGLLEPLSHPCHHSSVKFTGTFDAFYKISSTEGVYSLWRGLPPTLLMAIPATVVYFSLYDVLKDTYSSKLGAVNGAFLAGVLARVGASSLISPLEMIRTKAQSMHEFKPPIYKSLAKQISLMVKEQGLLSLYKGLGPTLLRDVPFSAIYWACYEKIMNTFFTMKQKFISSFFAGAVSGAIAATLTLPFDVVKTYKQIDWTHGSKPQPMRRLLKEIALREGFSGLFVGIVPRLAKVAPACAIMISSYETGKLYFRRNNQI
ncbi:probable mitochondrial glutathione transporter SLC25A40 [Zophobas morio]|uniref:probable mitochondrial glutathione transporter SLC25A40 n=1 Tax=Zophobas morio TaxID=2755281 RepID=UPI003082FCAE